MIALLLFALISCCLGDLTTSGPGYTYYCTGNCTADIETSTYGGMVFMGGGTDVDDAYRWLVQRAGGGDILILRSGPPGDDAYNPYIYGLERCHSVSTLIINDTIANEQSFVIQKILNAEGLYFAGGDQATYYEYWGSDSEGKISEAINQRVAQSVPVGGTSAGMAVLASYPFVALDGGVDSALGLNLPLDPSITLVDDFLHLHADLVGPLITDMHFNTRDRMGRLIGFLANALHRGWNAPRGFACNEKTAFLLDTSSGVGQLIGQGPAYALSYETRPTVLEKETPLTWKGINTQRLEPGSLFDFKAWKALDELIPPYTLNVDDGDLSSEGNDGNIY